MNISNLIWSFIGLIPQLLILSLCIYYLARKRSADGILMSIGSFIGILVSAFHLFLLPFMFSRNIFDDHSARISIISIVGIIGIIGSLAFAVGLFLLIQDNIKKNRK